MVIKRSWRTGWDPVLVALAVFFGLAAVFYLSAIAFGIWAATSGRY
jgi:hypothetical protein